VLLLVPDPACFCRCPFARWSRCDERSEEPRDRLCWCWFPTRRVLSVAVVRVWRGVPDPAGRGDDRNSVSPCPVVEVRRAQRGASRL